MPDLGLPTSIEVGVIVEWSGLTADIPAGWVICDGNNNTPNLLGLHIRGAVAGTDPGDTGGSDTHVVTTDELAIHAHSFSDSAHNHTTNFFDGTSSSGTGQIRASGGLTGSGVSTSNVSASVTISNTGSGNSHENRPAYRELAYIMKT